MEFYSNLADVVVHKTYGTYIFNMIYILQKITKMQILQNNLHQCME